MRSSNPLWREAQSILLRHCEEDRLSMSVMPGVHLMRFGWRSLPLVARQGPCMAMVLQGTKSVEFGQKHLEYGAGQYLLASMDLPATSRIVNASKTHPLLAVGVDIDFAELERGDPALRRAAAVEFSIRDNGLRRGCRTSGIRRSAASLAGHAATCEAAGAAGPAGNPVSPALRRFRFPAAGDLPERQPVQPHCRGDRLDSRDILQRVSWWGNWLITWA